MRALTWLQRFGHFTVIVIVKVLFSDSIFRFSSLTLAFHARIPGVVLDARSVVGIDLLSLDGRLAVRCSNTTLPYQEVKRFIRVARWIYKATPSEWHCNSLVAHAELISPMFAILSVLRVEAVCPRK